MVQLTQRTRQAYTQRTNGPFTAREPEKNRHQSPDRRKDTGETDADIQTRCYWPPSGRQIRYCERWRRYRHRGPRPAWRYVNHAVGRRRNALLSRRWERAAASRLVSASRRVSLCLICFSSGQHPARGRGPGRSRGRSRAPVSGLLATMQPDDPGMHRSATVDTLYIVSGRCVLELDDGSKTELGAGDVIVQSGTMHRWHNPWDEPCHVIAFLAGAHMK